MGKLANWIKYYSETLNNINIEMELQNEVASLSNHSTVMALMQTIKQIAYMSAEPNHEVYCMYLKSAIKDLMSGMDATDMLWKYDTILYNLKNPRPEHIGYRANILIIDDLCDIDKEELKEMLNKRGKNND